MGLFDEVETREDYFTFYSPSWDMKESLKHSPGKTYECDYCGVELEDWEAYMADGDIFCGCCKPS